jgi:hypothetical protein
LELLEWYKNKNKDVANLFSKNQMTGPKIQKKLCRACAELTTKAVIEDIGDEPFAILVDEARDCSIKEQMAVVLRYISNICLSVFILIIDVITY